MPATTKTRRTSQAKRAELERRLKEIRSQETTIKERIYKLEASIAGAPGMESARRLRLWNTVPAEEAPVVSHTRSRTRYQRRLVNRGRSRQALAALFLMGLALMLGIWLTWQMKVYGVM
jgi:hypothetical protein